MNEERIKQCKKDIEALELELKKLERSGYGVGDVFVSGTAKAMIFDGGFGYVGFLNLNTGTTFRPIKADEASPRNLNGQLIKVPNRNNLTAEEASRLIASYWVKEVTRDES